LPGAWRQRSIGVVQRPIHHGSQITPSTLARRFLSAPLPFFLQIASLSIALRQLRRALLLHRRIQQLLPDNHHIGRGIDPQLNALALHSKHIDRNHAIQDNGLTYFTTQYEHPTRSLLWPPLRSHQVPPAEWNVPVIKKETSSGSTDVTAVRPFPPSLLGPGIRERRAVQVL
jgi:hypothetical protein